MSGSLITRVLSTMAVVGLAVSGACSAPAGTPAAPMPVAVPPLPEFIKTGNITAVPPMVLLGQLTMVSVTVTNTGAQASNCTLMMYFDGAPLKSQNVTLAAGESQNVTFPLSSSQNGTHLIQIGDSTFKLMVHIVDTDMMGDMGPM
jgi:hypothetical protein